MSMADITGISTVPHALIGNNGNYAYITKRADRITNTDRTAMLAMEDFCQLDLRLTQDKYKGCLLYTSKEWVVELWAVNAGDVLKVPDNSSDEYMKLTSWHATYGVPFGFEKMYKYAGDKLRAIDRCV